MCPGGQISKFIITLQGYYLYHGGVLCIKLSHQLPTLNAMTGFCSWINYPKFVCCDKHQMIITHNMKLCHALYLVIQIQCQGHFGSISLIKEYLSELYLPHL